MSNGEVQFKLEHPEVSSQTFFLPLPAHNPQPCPPQNLKPKHSQVLQTRIHAHISSLRTHPPGQQGPEWHSWGLARAHTHHMPFAGQWDKDVTPFMDQQLAVDALVALPCDAPYPFTALATVRSLQGTTTLTISSRTIPAAKSPSHSPTRCSVIILECPEFNNSWRLHFTPRIQLNGVLFK